MDGGQYEAHLWDESTWNHNQDKKGKQGLFLSLALYLGKILY